MLRHGQLRRCATEAAAVLCSTATYAFPSQQFTIQGQSGLRFLLDPSSATMRTAADAVVKGAGSVADGVVTDAAGEVDLVHWEHAAVDQFKTLTDPASWWEELNWTDGPAVTMVECAVGEVVYIGAGAEGLGESGARYQTAFLRREYTREAFAVYAAATDPDSWRHLVRLGAPALSAPRPAPEQDAWRVARHWLDETDLTWMTPTHPVRRALDTFTCLVPEYVNGFRAPSDLIGALHPLLDAALGAHLD